MAWGGAFHLQEDSHCSVVGCSSSVGRDGHGKNAAEDHGGIENEEACSQCVGSNIDNGRRDDYGHRYLRSGRGQTHA